MSENVLKELKELSFRQKDNWPKIKTFLKDHYSEPELKSKEGKEYIFNELTNLLEKDFKTAIAFLEYGDEESRDWMISILAKFSAKMIMLFIEYNIGDHINTTITEDIFDYTIDICDKQNTFELAKKLALSLEYEIPSKFGGIGLQERVAIICYNKTGEQIFKDNNKRYKTRKTDFY